MSFRLVKSDFTLPGLGSRGKYCGADIISHYKENLTGIGYQVFKCRRIECPDCYEDWIRRTTFNIAVNILAYHLISGDIPHAITFSDHPDNTLNWDWDDYNNMFRTGYRHCKKLGVAGGTSIFHPFRMRGCIVKELIARGVKDKKGFWDAVRNDRLSMGDPYKYLKRGAHGHTIGFPSFIGEHSDPNFVVKKYAVLDSYKGKKDVYSAVIAHVRYLLSHVGIVRDECKHSIRQWGVFSHTSQNHFDPQKALGEEEYDKLCEKVASKLNMVWIDGELKYPNEKEISEDLIPINRLPYDKDAKALIEPRWLFASDFDRFWLQLIDHVERRVKSKKPILLKDISKLDRPPDVEIICLKRGEP